MSDRYAKLASLSKRGTLYGSISMLLEWDQETLMPNEAIQHRSAQIELIAKLQHEWMTGKEFQVALSSLIDLETGTILAKSLNDAQKAALIQWRRDFVQSKKLPSTFVEKWANVTSISSHVWNEAKEKNNWKLFQPHLEKIITLCREKADYIGYENHPYDALADLFEPTMNVKVLTTLFERLKLPLTNLLKKIQTKGAPDQSFLEKDYSHEKQLQMGRKALELMGFDKTFSRLDESFHPMCAGVHPRDIRMTTRVYPNDVITNILSCLHEGGHGLYNANLPIEHYGTPLAESCSLGIDESQSRTWETLIGRSFPFWEYFFPELQKTFPEELASITIEQFYKALNQVSPSFIRTDSDEVTYNLHIMLRFELEKALLEGSLAVSDLEEAWNEKMRSYFGITPSAPSLGCLQDIHWSLGFIGYFPTYTLGNLYAAQFFETLVGKHPNWKEKVAKGELTFISDWQKENIHRFGREYFPEDLCEKVTGKPLSEQPFVTYLENKYHPLYHIS